MSTGRRPARLLEPQVALSSYLEALLQEVPEYRPEADTDAEKPGVEVAGEAAPAPAHGGAPPWGRERFQCLLFKVCGLSLAVPLARLDGVIPWSDAVTPMPNSAAHFLGLLRHRERTVRVIDTARSVLPDAQRMGALAPPGERLGHILTVRGGHWGLACDALGEVLTLAPEDVRWRGAAGRRPWLAGTVLQHLCALLDVDALIDLLRPQAGPPAP